MCVQQVPPSLSRARQGNREQQLSTELRSWYIRSWSSEGWRSFLLPVPLVAELKSREIRAPFDSKEILFSFFF